MKERIGKGREVISFPSDYTVVDLETSGLDFETDSIIEIAAVKVRDGREISRFQTLVNPLFPICEPIQKLTGITNKMLADAPIFKDISMDVWNFLENEFLVGHCVDFDVTFLFDAFQKEESLIFGNNYMDTLPLSQKLFPELVHHRLVDMASYYKIDTLHSHRALADCRMNFKVFESMKQNILKFYSDFDTFRSKWDTLEKRIHASSISTTKDSFNTLHPIYGKVCVITGALDRLSRKDAMQQISDLGGKNCDKLNTFTNLLILGNASYCDLVTGISKKHKKALRLIDEGYPLDIITEDEFYLLLSN